MGVLLLAYLTLLAVLAVVTVPLLYGHPLRPYLPIFFVGGALCTCTEGVVGILLDVYDMRAGLLANYTRDTIFACLLTSGFIHPLMAVLYVRLAPRSPRLLAIVASVLLGLLEVWFVWSGHVVYKAWHPAASAVFYFAFFWTMWNLHSGRLRVPSWVFVLSMAFWLLVNLSDLLQGVLGLWHFPLTMKGDEISGSHLASNLYSVAVVIPVSMVAALVPAQWPRVILVAGGALGLVIAEALMLATGQLMFETWNLWLSAARYSFGVGAVWLFAWWLHRGDTLTVPRWEPPL